MPSRPNRRRLVVPLLAAAVFVLAACSGSDTNEDTSAAEVTPTTTRRAPPGATASTSTATPDADASPVAAAEPPPIPDGPIAEDLAADLTALLDILFINQDPFRLQGIEQIRRVGASEDVRVAWILVDALRFLPAFDIRAEVIRDALTELTGVEYADDPWWVAASNQLITWDLPAPPDYVQWKRVPFEDLYAPWAPFFDDTESGFDYRYLTWGGALADARTPEDVAIGRICAGCIPALHDPAVTDAAGGRWYPDDSIVFGLVVGDDARAYPKHMMEVHELVTDTLGGRRVSMPYCTLCGSAQAYYVDEPPEGFATLDLRTSGLLSRSNKVMFDLNTYSAFDTFTGRAVSGPLREVGAALEQITVVTSTWGDWKAEHPMTTIVASDAGIGRTYRQDPLRGRDDNGPIFPVGEVDPRLPVQELVLGVEADADTRVSFPVAAARLALADGQAVELAGVTVVADAGGLRALDVDGQELVSHQAFWFAWSQFWPDTLLWTGR